MRNLLPVIILLIFSCSAEKKIDRFLRKVPPKQVAVHIAKNYPEYLKADTIRFIDTIVTTKVIRVPELIRDTIYDTDTINDCRDFHYLDNVLRFDVRTSDEKTKVIYKIFERTIKDTVVVYVDKLIPCPPCPTEIIVQEIVKQHELTIAENKGKLSFFRNGFWILLAVILLAIGGKILRVMGKI